MIKFCFCLGTDFFHLFLFQKDEVDGISTVKFVFIQWVGENVKPMTKGKISTHRSTVEKAFHVSLLHCILLVIMFSRRTFDASIKL